jgi:hypothetical protein
MTARAEFIRTFILVLGGCGSAVLAGGFPKLGLQLELSGGGEDSTWAGGPSLSDAFTAGNLRPRPQGVRRNAANIETSSE